MKEFKGTKGKLSLRGCPFYNDDDGLYSGSFDIINENGTTFANVYAYKFYGIKSIDEAKANAQLISKAPEMLEKLKLVVECINTMYFYQLETLQPEIEELIKEATEVEP